MSLSIFCDSKIPIVFFLILENFFCDKKTELIEIQASVVGM